MKVNITKRGLLPALLSGSIVLALTVDVSGCKTPRSEAKGYGYFFGQYISGGTAEGSERTVEVGSTGGAGLGFGAYIIDRVSRKFKFLIGVQDRTARSGGYF